MGKGYKAEPSLINDVKMGWEGAGQSRHSNRMESIFPAGVEADTVDTGHCCFASPAERQIEIVGGSKPQRQIARLGEFIGRHQLRRGRFFPENIEGEANAMSMQGNPYVL